MSSTFGTCSAGMASRRDSMLALCQVMPATRSGCKMPNKFDALPNGIVEAVELARQYSAAGCNPYRGSVMKVLDGLAA